MKEKFGKLSEGVVDIKKVFVEKNEFLLNDDKKINTYYLKQSERKLCMNCLSKIGNADFIKQGIPYSVCSNCSHLNGLFEDSDEFAKSIYASNSDEGFTETYNSNDLSEFNNRVEKIYLPKAEFLHESLIEDKVKPENMEILDFGSGNGYFVAALDKMNFPKIKGLEVSESCVKFGNQMIKNNLLSVFDFDQTKKILSTTDYNLVSMIGVLEHLQNPYEILEIIKNNKNIDYIYISVPLFGFAVYLEMFFPNIFHRQLSRDHTHLYTKDSLEWITKHFNMEIISSWWFGLDMVDLLRFGSIKISKDKGNKMLDHWTSTFLPLIDKLQIEIDKRYLCSEVHMLIKTRSN